MIYEGKRMTRVEFLRRQVEDHRRWLEEHGRSRAGYVERYGSKHDPEHYGDGGETIYEADRNALERAELELWAVTGRR